MVNSEHFNLILFSNLVLKHNDTEHMYVIWRISFKGGAMIIFHARATASSCVETIYEWLSHIDHLLLARFYHTMSLM